jgi:aminoglycoside phosphotransferase (APT) family kinase protein
MNDKEKMIRQLVSMQLIDPKLPVTLEPMTGGVSSDIWLIDNVVRRYVLKEARSRLKVADHWEADLSRNYAEQQFIHFVRQFVPEAVPDILISDPDLPFFIMEYLGSPLENWKQKLLEGRFETKDAVRAARLLANIHNQGRKDPEVPHLFDYSSIFMHCESNPT